MNCYANPILHAGGRILLMRDFEPGRALSVIGDPALGSRIFGVPAPYQFMMQHLISWLRICPACKRQALVALPC